MKVSTGAAIEHTEIPILRGLRHVSERSQRHGGVVPILEVLDSFESPWLTCLVSPRFFGNSRELALRNAEAQLRDDQLLAVARDVSAALAHCHRHFTLHADLHPQNIFVKRRPFRGELSWLSRPPGRSPGSGVCVPGGR